ncbi:rhodanese-related sulfurtransferase [Rhodoferax ferrireducens]|uniref:Rhodanese-related sulfurtransferase n=1 Tax=Rhodoferax ferrireducens TaxID=192843 RepID=A0ABU2C6I1_9BURK|nr:rhodanese-like domain-containing protein [Rhodoferax ferrireducens]MDR7376949.1 rhodanese-related sulfurtransferase [Rhodoferax ferrireducens]
MIAQITPTDLPQWLQGQTDPVVLDVREPAEWQAASVQADGFTLVQLSMNEIPGRLAELDPQRPIACLCHHGARSQRVAQFLLQNGFENVVNIAGGIDAWSLQRDPGVPRY